MSKLIGNKPGQVPVNADLGDLAYQDADKLATINVADGGLIVTKDGDVGIGTSSPAEPLHVIGNARIQRVTNASVELISDNNTGSNPYAIRSQTDTFSILNQAQSGFGTGGKFLEYTEGGSLRLMGETYLDSSGNVGIGTASPSSKLEVNGLLSASSKNFVIDHPTRDGYKLRYGCLEGPENGVYVRGKTSSKTITLPDYWQNLVHEDSITVQLTPIGATASLYVIDYDTAEVNIGGDDVEYFYTIQGERKDIDKIVVEYENPPVSA